MASLAVIRFLIATANSRRRDDNMDSKLIIGGIIFGYFCLAFVGYIGWIIYRDIKATRKKNESLYSILRVPANVPQQQLKAEAQKEAQRIEDAYRILSDKQSRAAYDAELLHSRLFFMFGVLMLAAFLTYLLYYAVKLLS